MKHRLLDNKTQFYGEVFVYFHIYIFCVDLHEHIILFDDPRSHKHTQTPDMSRLWTGDSSLNSRRRGRRRRGRRRRRRMRAESGNFSSHHQIHKSYRCT